MGTMAVRRGQTATEGSGHKMSILISPVCFKTRDAIAILFLKVYTRQSSQVLYVTSKPFPLKRETPFLYQKALILTEKTLGQQIL